MHENFILRDPAICDYSDRLLGRLAAVSGTELFAKIDDGMRGWAVSWCFSSGRMLAPP
jgi:hypothetical protein